MKTNLHAWLVAIALSAVAYGLGASVALMKEAAREKAKQERLERYEREGRRW